MRNWTVSWFNEGYLILTLGHCYIPNSTYSDISLRYELKADHDMLHIMY